MAPGNIKKKRTSKKKILRPDDPEAQDHVLYRKERKKLKSGQYKTFLVAQERDALLNEIAGYVQKAQPEDAGNAEDQADIFEQADTDIHQLPFFCPKKPHIVIITHLFMWGFHALTVIETGAETYSVTICRQSRTLAPGHAQQGGCG